MPIDISACRLLLQSRENLFPMSLPGQRQGGARTRFNIISNNYQSETSRGLYAPLKSVNFDRNLTRISRVYLCIRTSRSIEKVEKDELSTNMVTACAERNESRQEEGCFIRTRGRDYKELSCHRVARLFPSLVYNDVHAWHASLCMMAYIQIALYRRMRRARAYRCER